MIKGLEVLQEHRNQQQGVCVYADDYLDIIEKELKALEIIKDKEVNVFIFLHSGDLETYNDMVEDHRKLTQEEYDLLKEVLSYDD